MTLSNDVTVLVSAQCSIVTHKDEIQTKIIIWDIKTLKQNLYLHQSVHAIQSMAFSKYSIYINHIDNLFFFYSIEMIVF
jgi:hypothetical protein